MQRGLLLPLAGGVAALVVAMGIGRFGYTPILPLMAAQAGLEPAMAGYLGAANYLGYLVGALAASLRPMRSQRERVLQLALLASLLTTGGMALLSAAPAWLALRFLAGLASALVFVLASSLLLEQLPAPWSGIFYGGVGLGIVATGLAVPLLDQWGGWRWSWGGLALLALPLAGLAWLTLRERPPLAAAAASPRRSGGAGLLPWLTAAYGLEGLGYIVTGTFLVSVVSEQIGSGGVGASSWVLVGLAAIPSCYGWARLAERWGAPETLVFIFLLQAVGIALPAISPTLPSALLGALLFGGTFMGITTLTLGIARSGAPGQSAGAIGRLTAVYGLGQVIGPAGAGWLIGRTASYQGALLLAAAIVIGGAVLLLVGYVQVERKENRHALRQHQDHS